jgi:putative hemolysin
MSGDTTLNIILLLLCLLLSAFFSSSETAFISLQKIRLKHLADSNVSGAEKLAKLTKQPERILTTILLGNNFVNTAAAALGTLIAMSILGEESAALVATIGVTILLLIFGEIGPKTLATRQGERMALLYVHPIDLLMKILYPLVIVFVWIGDKISRTFGGASVPQTLINEGEIRTVISTGVEEGTIEKTEAEMMEGVFKFGNREVGQIMTPRPDIIWVEKDATLGKFLSIYAESLHSRFPIYENDTDNIVGFLWIKDILMAQAKGEIQKESSLAGLVRPINFVPESKLVGELFAEMQEKGNQMVMVVDEFGGIAGLVTTEDLLEEIVGDLGDELAKVEEEFKTIDEKTFQIDGGMRIDDVSKEISLSFPDGNYETVAGFVLSILGHIPKEGERIHNEKLGLTFTVVEMKDFKIEKILITKD